jgi:hypothetical protein
MSSIKPPGKLSVKSFSYLGWKLNKFPAATPT